MLNLLRVARLPHNAVVRASMAAQAVALVEAQVKGPAAVNPELEAAIRNRCSAALRQFNWPT
jgi:hypothetical protein